MEEGRILLAEGVEAAVGADLGRGALLLASVAGAAQGALKRVDRLGRLGSVEAAAQVDPGGERQEAADLVAGAGEEHRHHGEGVAVALLALLAHERAVDLALLPAAEPPFAEEDRDGLRLVERPLERLRPGEPRDQVLAVHERLDAARAEQPQHGGDGLAVRRVVAQEDVHALIIGWATDSRTTAGPQLVLSRCGGGAYAGRKALRSLRVRSIPRLQALLFTAVLCGPAVAPAVAGSLAAAEVWVSAGLAAANGGDDEGAIAAFRSALAEDPDDGTARWLLGLALLRLGRAGEAVAELEASLNSPRPPRAPAGRVKEDLAEARRAAEGEVAPAPEPLPVPEWRGSLFEPGRRPAFEGRLGVAAGTDSNPALLDEGLALPPAPGDPPVPGGESDEVALLDLRLAWQPRLSGRWSLDLALDGAATLHRDLGAFDVAAARAAVSLARGAAPDGALAGPLGPARTELGTGRVGFVLQAGGSRYELDGEDYADAVEAGAALVVRPLKAPRWATSLGLHVEDRSYAGFHDGRGGQRVTVELRESVLLGRPDRSLALVARAGTVSADSDQFSQDLLEGGVELALPLGGRASAAGGLLVRRDDFDDPSSNIFVFNGDPRRDTTVEATAALAVALARRLAWTVRGTWVDRDSNVEAGVATLDYDRAVVTTGFALGF